MKLDIVVALIIAVFAMFMAVYLFLATTPLGFRIRYGYWPELVVRRIRVGNVD
jgi:hypothetical protein